jgi:hypothetical protein
VEAAAVTFLSLVHEFKLIDCEFISVILEIDNQVLGSTSTE